MIWKEKRVFFCVAMLFFIMASFSLSSNDHNQSLRFLYGSDFHYQPIIVNGEIVKNSLCHSGGNWVIFRRYEAIKSFLSQMKRPLKILDIGANNGFFSLKIAEDFPNSHCIMVDKTSRLVDICLANTQRNNVLYLQKHFDIHCLRKLAAKERFDVILCLFVLHHVDHWKLWLKKLKEICCYLIIEFPSLKDPVNKARNTQALSAHILNHEKFELLGRFPRIKNHQLHEEDYLVLIKGNSQAPPPDIGIRSSTFFLLNGQFPRPSFVRERYGVKDNYKLYGPIGK